MSLLLFWKKCFKSYFIFIQLYNFRVYWHQKDFDTFLANPVNVPLYTGYTDYLAPALYYKINSNIINYELEH